VSVALKKLCEQIIKKLKLWKNYYCCYYQQSPMVKTCILIIAL
jgi:hypothetical protein